MSPPRRSTRSPPASVEPGLANLLPPVRLDVTTPEDWAFDDLDAVVAINMIHISPWCATEGLLRGAAGALRGPADCSISTAHLSKPAGPWRRATRPSMRTCARAILSWGLRRLETVAQTAAGHRLHFVRTVDMPANNLSVAFRKD